MPKALLCAALLLAAYSTNGLCQDAPASERRWGGSGRPSEAQIAEWRAKRAAREAAAAETPTAPAMTGADHGHAGNDTKPAAMGAAAVPAATVAKPTANGAAAPGLQASPADDGTRRGGRSGVTGTLGAPGSRDVLWLSDTPPARGDGKPRWSGMGGMTMGGDRRGPPVKRLWLRSGADPGQAGYAHDDAEAETETLLVTPQGKPEGEPLAAGRGGLSFEMPAQGYYRLYRSSRRLQGDVLAVSVAKAEITSFSHSGDEGERNQALAAPRVLDSAPIEIVREKQPDEKLFFQLKSGDRQSFLVLRQGLPLAGARVRFVSHQGWVKEAVSDGQGRVDFQVVRDYFPAWNDFEKRFKASYLVIAETSVAEAGRFRDQPYSRVNYQTTLSGNYYPSPDDYRSYAWGLGIGFAFLLFCGTAVYLYRRRRVKPFAEVRFDDKS